MGLKSAAELTFVDFVIMAMIKWLICLRISPKVKKSCIDAHKSPPTILHDFLKKEEYPSGPRALSSLILKRACLLSAAVIGASRKL